MLPSPKGPMRLNAAAKAPRLARMRSRPVATMMTSPFFKSKVWYMSPVTMGQREIRWKSMHGI